MFDCNHNYIFNVPLHFCNWTYFLKFIIISLHSYMVSSIPMLYELFSNIYLTHRCKCLIIIITIFSIFYCILFCNCNYLSIIICLHKVVWFQVFLSNTNNLCTIWCFQVCIYPTNPLQEEYEIRSFFFKNCTGGSHLEFSFNNDCSFKVKKKTKQINLVYPTIYP